MSDAEDSPLDTLKSAQSKEKKDLRFKISALKKAVPNSDKKKKKEVAEQVEKLEKELQAKHDKELAELEAKLADCKVSVEADTSATENGEEAQSSTAEPKGPKVSKKQKRLEKKQEENKRREAAAIEDELAMQKSRATLESNSMKQVLAARSLALHEIAPDGDCLYNSIAHQISLVGESVLNGENVRCCAAMYLRSHPDDFLPFLTDGTGETLTEAGFERYCRTVEATSAKGGVWGGDVEIRAISQAYKHKIIVLQPDGQPITFGDEFDTKPITITYHRFAYALGAHYNSTIEA